jgi:hypothetical protein
MTTIGQLVSTLFAKYELQFRDAKLAAVATQLALEELLRERARAGEAHASVTPTTHAA